MFEEVTKEFIRTHEFLSDIPIVKPRRQSFRLSRQNLPPPNAELQTELRRNFSAIMATNFNGDYVAVENNCLINAETMRKYLNGRRPITVPAVAKFCIGARLSLEKTCELFKLCGHVLSPKLYRPDAIVVDVLKCGETIQDFYEVTKEFGIDYILRGFDRSLA